MSESPRSSVSGLWTCPHFPFPKTPPSPSHPHPLLTRLPSETSSSASRLLESPPLYDRRGFLSLVRLDCSMPSSSCLLLYLRLWTPLLDSFRLTRLRFLLLPPPRRTNRPSHHGPLLQYPIRSRGTQKGLVQRGFRRDQCLRCDVDGRGGVPSFVSSVSSS